MKLRISLFNVYVGLCLTKKYINMYGRLKISTLTSYALFYALLYGSKQIIFRVWQTVFGNTKTRVKKYIMTSTNTCASAEISSTRCRSNICYVDAYNSHSWMCWI